MIKSINEQFNTNNSELVSILDELPLWSAPFGLKLLEIVKYRPNINILDVGCGTGFLLIELAQRFGASCNVFGIDPWEKAIERANFKINVLNLKNIKIVKEYAEEMQFDDNFFDLIVSNNGINNVEDPDEVLFQCHRVSKPGAQFVITVNLPGTMNEFYTIFEKTLKENNMEIEIALMNEHILSKRKPLNVTLESIKNAGFNKININTDFFKMRFLDGTALFNHYFIKSFFLESWKKIVPSDMRDEIFRQLERNLNIEAQEKGELCLTVPFVCLDSRKE